MLHHLRSAPTSHPDLRLVQFAPADEPTRNALTRLVEQGAGVALVDARPIAVARIGEREDGVVPCHGDL